MVTDMGRWSTNVADPERMIVPVQIREDLTARLQIPVDLTLAEAEKIARVVLAYATETDDRDGEHLKRLRDAAESADRGEGVSLKGLPRKERRKLLASAETPAPLSHTGVNHG